MTYFSMRESWFDRNFGTILFVGFVSLLLFMFFIATEQITVVEKMYQNCLADGHKDYECYSMLRGRK